MYPYSPNAEDIDAFLYITIYIRRFIAGRVEDTRILKEAIVHCPRYKSGKHDSAPPSKQGE